MGSKAAAMATRSRNELLTAKMVEEAGGDWDHTRETWVFDEDGSSGPFVKKPRMVTKDGQANFGGYLFEVFE
jgi:hypothetical protein